LNVSYITINIELSCLINLFVALEQLYQLGWLIYCADNKICHCFLILATIYIDYKEVCLAIGIKNGQQCGICEVPFHKMQNITIQWPLRTPAQTQNQIQRQNIEEIAKEDPS
jgi:hypothetical protein